MKNVNMAVKGNILTITVDMSKSQGLSASGKNEIIATTAGNTGVPDTDATLGLNLYRKPVAKVAVKAPVAPKA